MITPSEGVGGCTPRPKKLSPASITTPKATPTLAWTRIGAPMFGRISRNRMLEARWCEDIDEIHIGRRVGHQLGANHDGEKHEARDDSPGQRGPVPQKRSPAEAPHLSGSAWDLATCRRGRRRGLRLAR